MRCVRSRNIHDQDQVTVLIICLYSFSSKEPIFERNFSGTFDVSCGRFSNANSLVLRDSGTVS